MSSAHCNAYTAPVVIIVWFYVCMHFYLPNSQPSSLFLCSSQLEALDVINAKVASRRLPMDIIDAEYQFDRHKLVFFFAACRRIDFRELVSELFGLYKTRIWMQQVDPLTAEDDDSSGAMLAKQGGFLISPSAFQERQQQKQHMPLEPVPQSNKNFLDRSLAWLSTDQQDQQDQQ